MTRFFPIQRPVFTPARVVLSVVALVLLAHSDAEGRCSHLVSSRSDIARHSFLTMGLVVNLSEQSTELPTPAPQTPCAGVWCSGQPATPVVPPGMVSLRIESWAWRPSSPATDASTFFFIPAEERDARAVSQASSVFHPPRLRSLAFLTSCALARNESSRTPCEAAPRRIRAPRCSFENDPPSIARNR
jgi:hypothetical protein